MADMNQDPSLRSQPTDAQISAADFLIQYGATESVPNWDAGLGAQYEAAVARIERDIEDAAFEQGSLDPRDEQITRDQRIAAARERLF